MKKNLNFGQKLTKADQRKILGGSGGTRECNCYTTDPTQGVDKTCACNATIAQCCGSNYTAMNCGACSS